MIKSCFVFAVTQWFLTHFFFLPIAGQLLITKNMTEKYFHLALLLINVLCLIDWIDVTETLGGSFPIVKPSCLKHKRTKKIITHKFSIDALFYPAEPARSTLYYYQSNHIKICKLGGTSDLRWKFNAIRYCTKRLFIRTLFLRPKRVTNTVENKFSKHFTSIIFTIQTI